MVLRIYLQKIYQTQQEDRSGEYPFGISDGFCSVPNSLPPIHISISNTHSSISHNEPNNIDFTVAEDIVGQFNKISGCQT